MVEFDFEAAVGAIAAAPFDGHWRDALAHIAAAGGGQTSQLIGVSRTGAIQFDYTHNVAPEIVAEFEARSGVDPALNPRAKVLLRPAGEVFDDDDFIVEDERRRNPFYADFFRRADIPFCCEARVEVGHGLQLVAISFRGKEVGSVSREEKARFASLIPHIKAAARLEAELELRGIDLTRGAYEALAYPVFLLDGAGQVLAQNAAADALLRLSQFLRLRHRRLQATDQMADTKLQAALALATATSTGGMAPPGPARVLLRHDHDLLVAETAPLPRNMQGGFRFGAVAMVALPRWRGTREGEDGELLREAFALTAGEAEIALCLLKGAGVAEVALQRGVLPDTVRVQLKAIFRKTGCGSQSMLTAVLAQLLGW